MDLSAAAMRFDNPVLLDSSGLLELAGLPLHPLLVHATVVLTPLTALALALCAVWPAARRRLGLALPIAAVMIAVLVPITAVTGESLADAIGRTPAVLQHRALGLMLIPWAIALVPASLAVWGSDRLQRLVRRAQESDHKDRADRRGAVIAWAIGVLGVVCALGTLVVVVLTGDAGARAVWGWLL